MEYFRSFGLLLLGVLKRIYYLIPAFVTDAFDVLERFGVHMNVPPAISYTLAGLGFLVAVLLTYHEQRMKAIMAVQDLGTYKKQSVRPPRTRLNLDDHTVIDNLNRRMWDLHGHDDKAGITQDYQNNVDTDIILERKCTQCGETRNRPGNDIL